MLSRIILTTVTVRVTACRNFATPFFDEITAEQRRIILR